MMHDKVTGALAIVAIASLFEEDCRPVQTVYVNEMHGSIKRVTPSLRQYIKSLPLGRFSSSCKGFTQGRQPTSLDASVALKAFLAMQSWNG